MKKSTAMKLTILFIGIIAGALIFSQFHTSSAPVGYTYSGEKLASKNGRDLPIESFMTIRLQNSGILMSPMKMK